VLEYSSKTDMILDYFDSNSSEHKFDYDIDSSEEKFLTGPA
jgi:hypothetical protein